MAPRHQRVLWILLGGLTVLIGLIALIVPLLPTTPFLLLGAACFARGSQRCEAWLLQAPVLGRMISDYHQRGGVSRRQRYGALALVWTSLAMTTWMLWPPGVLSGTLVTITAAVTTTIILRLPAARPDQS